MVIRIALYSHDSVGLGHVRRNLAIAHALTRTLPGLLGEDVTGMLVSGQPAATSFPVPPGWDWLIVPSITTRSGGYASRHLTAGIKRVTAMRGGSVRAAIAAFGPDLFVADRHPFGVHRELDTTLRWLRRRRPSCTTVLGLRDVLDEPRAMKAEWKALGGASAVRAHYDAIWAYGDPRIRDISATGELPGGLRGLVHHTGYLSHGRLDEGPSVVEPPFVLTTVGGGSDGRALAVAAAGARLPDGIEHVIVTGPQMPEDDHRAILRRARPGTSVVRTVPEPVALVRRAEGVVCMGGYNTVCEVMSTTTPALIVPRVHRRLEQALRADALAAHGAIDTMPAAGLTPAPLADWFARSIGREVHRTGIDLDGLAAVGRLAADLLAGAALTGVRRAV